MIILTKEESKQHEYHIAVRRFSKRQTKRKKTYTNALAVFHFDEGRT
jgi:hypothetical protein